jgi:uncharacterized protein DUF5522
MGKKLIEGIDYVLDEHGRRVFTRAYLLNLGYCCRADCQNCPYQTKSLVYDDPLEEDSTEAA